MDPSSQKPTWALTQGLFDKLLLWLDSDRERAGEKYENLRHKLIRFFEWRACAGPEDHADEVINRVARKIEQGEEIQARDPYTYICGVGRMVLREALRQQERERSAQEEWARREPRGSDRGRAERQRACLEQCLQELPVASRELILQYNAGEKAARIAIRQKLAEQLQIPLNALRIRCHRIREKLEACVSHCLQVGAAPLK